MVQALLTHLAMPPAPLQPDDPHHPPRLDDLRWQRLLLRQPAADFVYAVQTTGIVCRPGCSSRLPLRRNVRFFSAIGPALDAGFRPCQRCRPDREPSPNQAVSAAARLIAENLDRNLSLAELASHAGLSRAHLQRLFSQTFGLSPRRYAETLRIQHLAATLPSESVTDATYTAGFSAPSRMYQAAARFNLQPSHLTHGGRSMHLRYTTAPSPFGGRILAAATPRGIAAVLLADDDNALLAELSSRFPQAHIEPASDPELQGRLQTLIESVQTGTSILDLPLDLRGTAFQTAVWNALRQIPRGETRTYAQLAASIGRPTATRAVARACATNPAALAVPCHRVIGSTGKLTGYRWGIQRKQQILESEQRIPNHPKVTD